MTTNEELIQFIKNSPSVFHAVKTIREYLDEAGFTNLPESTDWSLAPGNYYTTRNDSSLIAFRIPANATHFQLCATHSDSPTFKLKNVPELDGDYLKLNVEPYGGMIDYTWFDKPLSIAGRIIVRQEYGMSFQGNNCSSSDNTVYSNTAQAIQLESRLVYIDKDILMIPSVPIHMNRDVNKGAAFNHQIDLCPMCSAGELKAGAIDEIIAKELGISASCIVSRDLFLVNRQEGCVWGIDNEFISSGKLDDLQAVFSALKGFLSSKTIKNDNNRSSIDTFCCFDNEEVGSTTMQGACSTFLKDTLTRITDELGLSYYPTIAKSFMVSFDNAHAVHPNHPELYDNENRCFMNKGIVIKENASQKYTTDALSRAVFKEVCERTGVPVQTFANRSDMAGGSTLGNLSNTQVSLHAVDIGIAQLAMHSAFETAGSKDTDFAISALRQFYSENIIIGDSGTQFYRQRLY